QARSTDRRSGDRPARAEFHPRGRVRFPPDPLGPGGNRPEVAAALPGEPGAAIRAAALAVHFGPRPAAVVASHAVHAVAYRHPHLLLLPGIERVVHVEPGLAHLPTRAFHLTARL